MNFANDTTTLIIIIPFNHRQLPKAGNLNKKFPVGRFWRFQVDFKTRSDQTFNLLLLIQVVADPTVEVFASRDVDSFLLPRCEQICMRYTIQYNTCKYKIHKTLIVLYHNVPLRERAAVGQWLEDSEKQVVNQAGSPTHCHGSRGI